MYNLAVIFNLCIKLSNILILLNAYCKNMNQDPEPARGFRHKGILCKIDFEKVFGCLLETSPGASITSWIWIEVDFLDIQSPQQLKLLYYCQWPPRKMVLQQEGLETRKSHLPYALFTCGGFLRLHPRKSSFRKSNCWQDKQDAFNSSMIPYYFANILNPTFRCSS